VSGVSGRDDRGFGQEGWVARQKSARFGKRPLQQRGNKKDARCLSRLRVNRKRPLERHGDTCSGGNIPEGRCGRTRTARELQLGVGVGTNFAAQVNFFVLRSGPFHVGAPGNQILYDTERIPRQELEGKTQKSERYRAIIRGEQVTKDRGRCVACVIVR